jgi:hypothetical protein
MEPDRRDVIAALGGAALVDAMSSEAKAEALEEYMAQQLDASMAAKLGVPLTTPTVAEIEAQIESRPFRKGVGTLFAVGASTPFGNRVEGEADTVKLLPGMPAKPTLLDFFKFRFAPATHVLQSADKALTAGMPEDIVLACLLHDTAHALMKADHGWWAAQLYEPYVSPKVTFAIRYHQALRFFPDKAFGYEYPGLYNKIFGKDYVPPEYIKAAHDFAKAHKWYSAARLVTVNDLYSFDPNHVVDPAKFTDIIGRHFKQPKEGLGYDASPTAHMWRTIINPDVGL